MMEGAEVLQPGQRVEYFSQTFSRWMPALVLGFDSSRGVYQLDVHPAADPEKVRPLANATDDRFKGAPVWQKSLDDTVTRFETGDLVEYFSTSYNLWIPAEVRGWDRQRHCYILNIQPVAAPHKVRRRAIATTTAGTDTAVCLEVAEVGLPPFTSPAAPCETRYGEAQDAEDTGFSCPVCLEKVKMDGSIQLDCDHRFCANCFSSYVSGKIMDGQVAADELVCPLPDCKTEITVAQVEGTASSPVWEKFLQFRMDLWECRADGRVIECPTQKCGKFLVELNVDIATCPRCGQEFCGRCGDQKHEGISCDSLKAWRQQNDAEESFEELMEQQQWRRCPRCRAPSERESGCNFMQCRSSICRKRTYWCYVCGKELSKEEHYAHFPRGPYEDECCETDQAPFECFRDPADPSAGFGGPLRSPPQSPPSQGGAAAAMEAAAEASFANH